MPRASNFVGLMKTHGRMPWTEMCPSLGRYLHRTSTPTIDIQKFFFVGTRTHHASVSYKGREIEDTQPYGPRATAFGFCPCGQSCNDLHRHEWSGKTILPQHKFHFHAHFFQPCNLTFLMDETVDLEQCISLSVSSLSSVLVLSGNVLTCEIFVQGLHCQPRTVRVQIITPCLIAAECTNLFWHSVLGFPQRCI